MRGKAAEAAPGSLALSQAPLTWRGHQYFLKYFAKALQKYDLHKILDGVNMGAEMTNLRKHNAQHFPEADEAALLRGGT